MKPIQHTTAVPSHYDKEAEHYDTFNEEKSQIINQQLATILAKHKTQTVLDLACGTGSQVVYLAKKGYTVVGVDINEKMLTQARKKISHEKLNIQLVTGDMRTTKIGSFDTVITIFNAIGHLTKKDFETTIKNIHSQLNNAGLYIFDIFNLDYLLHKDNITKLTIDWLKKSHNTTVREIQYSTIDTAGVLTSYDIYHEQKNNTEIDISHIASVYCTTTATAS